MVVMHRVGLGLVLCLAGIIAAGSLDTLEWTWPWNILVSFALWVPGIALIEPALERRANRWLGRRQ